MNVVVKLQGGLGNQMFQYGLGKKISKETGRKLILDLSFLKRRDLGPDFTYRNFDLDIFKLSNVEIVDYYDSEYEYIKEDFENASLSSIDNFFNKVRNSSSDTIYLDGYWASPKYFENIKFEFNEDVLECSKDLLKEIEGTNSVMLNIRRTDFLKNDFHGTYGRDYIIKGINNLSKKIDNLKFFIFSDDIEWCENNLKDIPNSKIVTHKHKGNKFYNYLLLMSKCKHFIIPNSTFAWWAAYICENKNKKVLYPEIWLKGLDSEQELLYYKLNWEKNI